MGAAHELVLYVRGRLTPTLRATLLEPGAFDQEDGQHFTEATTPDMDLAGSGQAGSPHVFVLSLRKSSTTRWVEGLTEAFDGGPEAILVVTGDYIDGPAEVYRLGYQPVAGY